MDKYTIDLDKLLNDFEYSELTEQQNNIISSNCQNAQQLIQQSANNINNSKSVISSQKHSINNVFHSLNEYLNTDINVTQQPSTSLLTSTNDPTKPACDDKTDADDDVDIVAKNLVRIATKDKIQVPSIQDIFKNITNNEDDGEVEATASPEDHINVNKVSENVFVELINDKNSNSELNNPEIKSENSENLIETKQDDVEISENNDIGDNSVKINTDSENLILNKQQVLSSKILKINDDSIEVEIVQQENREHQTECIEPELVKFQNSIDDLSDTEIENELAQLEKEYQDKFIIKDDEHLDDIKEEDEEEIAIAEKEELQQQQQQQQQQQLVERSADGDAAITAATVTTSATVAATTAVAVIVASVGKSEESVITAKTKSDAEKETEILCNNLTSVSSGADDKPTEQKEAAAAAKEEEIQGKNEENLEQQQSQLKNEEVLEEKRTAPGREEIKEEFKEETVKRRTKEIGKSLGECELVMERERPKKKDSSSKKKKRDKESSSSSSSLSTSSSLSSDSCSTKIDCSAKTTLEEIHVETVRPFSDEISDIREEIIGDKSRDISTEQSSIFVTDSVCDSYKETTETKHCNSMKPLKTESSMVSAFQVRPNSLDLNPAEAQNDSLTIDLIGAPGSTPFNNVYVSLPPEDGSSSATMRESNSENNNVNNDTNNNNNGNSEIVVNHTAINGEQHRQQQQQHSENNAKESNEEEEQQQPAEEERDDEDNDDDDDDVPIARVAAAIVNNHENMNQQHQNNHHQQHHHHHHRHESLRSPTLSEESSSYEQSNTDSPNTSDSCNDTSLDADDMEHATPRNFKNINKQIMNIEQERLSSATMQQHLRQQNIIANAADVVATATLANNARNSNDNATTTTTTTTTNDDNSAWLGRIAPYWTPDTDALCCLHCNEKFTLIKRRHHCRACGLVLCSKCCNMKCRLTYMDNQEARVCIKCFDILQSKADGGSNNTAIVGSSSPATTLTTPPTSVNNSSSGSSETSPEAPGSVASHRLNPNNPMEYCSTVPPLQQIQGAGAQPPPSVMVPVGVLKRKGSGKGRTNKSVMFMDGIRPGCDLTELDTDFNYKQTTTNTATSTTTRIVLRGGDGSVTRTTTTTSGLNKQQQQLNQPINYRQNNKNLPKLDPVTSSYIPPENDSLPPIVNVMKSDMFYTECSNNNATVEMLKTETVTFALQRNFHIQVKIINMDCCINKHAWCFATDGLISVGQDEIVILLEFIDNERTVPKDIFLHLNNIYNDAVKGTSITELGLSIHSTSNFLESKNHAGFLYVKPTFQCIQNVLTPKEPYLIGILIHRWETPWAKIFPLRLLLRLGAEYRYYPSPIISTRHRDSVYVEIGHTIINLLADFRNFSYTIPSVRGLTIHMEDKSTTVSIPMNRYDQVMKAVNNSSDHILAFGGNFSPQADSHLVCIQDTHGNNENAYTTHAINIHNKPRRITGASFIVLNGALKSSSGLTAKSSIVEDGLMVQILPEQMLKLRNALKTMKNFRINCGCINAPQSDETVTIQWIENDINFNIGVLSPIDNMPLSGIPSIRVHNGRDFVCNSGNKMIRWTEVFIIQSGEEIMRTQDPIDVSKISESISKATSQALVKYLDLLATNSCTKIGIRTTLHIENVSYLAGSNGTKLPPIYMKSLDNELIPVLHKITSNFSDQASVVLELKFHILNV